jgi:hypothetical protein
LLSVEYSIDHLQKEVILNQSRRRNQVSTRVVSAEIICRRIMIHEKTASKDKQSIASIALIEAESSSRSIREIRRESIISTDEIKDEFDAASTSYHIQNLDQLKY